MLTSHSAGIQFFPFTFPVVSVLVGGAPAPGVKPAVSSVFQFILPAMPCSFPTQRICGPTSLKITVLGEIDATVFLNRSQSYTCFFPLGPSPFAPSHHNSQIGP